MLRATLFPLLLLQAHIMNAKMDKEGGNDIDKPFKIVKILTLKCCEKELTGVARRLSAVFFPLPLQGTPSKSDNSDWKSDDSTSSRGIRGRFSSTSTFKSDRISMAKRNALFVTKQCPRDFSIY